MRSRKCAEGKLRKCYSIKGLGPKNFLISRNMKLSEMRKSACLEAGQQIAKLCFATAAVVILVFINSNIHDLVSCLSKQHNIVPEPPPTTSSPPPPALHSCEKQRFVVRDSYFRPQNVSVTCCDSQVILAHNNSILFMSENDQAASWLDWVKTCTYGARECGFQSNPSSTDCRKISKFRDNTLCFDENFVPTRAVFAKHVFHGLDLHSMLTFLADKC